MSEQPVRQLALDLGARVAYGAADFLVAPCNSDAARWIERWPDWPGGGLVVHGPAGAGKSHLAHLWAARSRAAYGHGSSLDDGAVAGISADEPAAIVVDDADAVGDETALLHLYNIARGRGASVMLTGRTPPARWGLALPDLRSRLCALPAVGIGPPDDAVLSALLVKQFGDRQLQVGDDVVGYLIKRMPRAFAAAGRLVEALDGEALGRGRAITVPLCRDVLDHLSDNS